MGILMWASSRPSARSTAAGRAPVLSRWAILAAAAALAVPAAADGHFSAGFYSHSRSDCASRTDPITVIFYGEATAARTLNHVAFHTGWSGGATGGNQYFATHGICYPSFGERYDGTVEDRFHIRAQKTYHGDATWGTTTMSTPHHEDWVTWIWTDCASNGFGNHAVDKGGVDKGGGLQSGFDQGRTAIYNAFYGRSGHEYGGLSYWGNTQEFKQCDGDWAGSHGNVYWFRIPAWSH